MDLLSDYLQSRRQTIDRALDRYLPSPNVEPTRIHECMRYSALGGKRARPILALAVAEMLGAPAARVLPTCVAVELIHTHSLILDDMPCMDNDDHRRGRPTSHRLFGEGVALLAADALLNLAISILGRNHRLAGLHPEVALEIIMEVGEAVGTTGVIAGQADDLAYSRLKGDAALLERIHVNKTANLFRLSARAGALVAGATPRELGAVSVYAEHLGLAFQIVDDILDMRRGEPPKGGREEPSYAAAYGAEEARSLAAATTERAILALASFGGGAEVLRQLAECNLRRDS